MSPNEFQRNGQITSDALSALIVDALVDASLIKPENFELAVSIATEEINARKAAGDY